MEWINWAIIGVGVVIVILIALQDRSSGVGGAFGGSDMGGVYQKRRGAERFLFGTTVASIAIFIGLAVFNLTQIEPTTVPPATTEIPDINIGDIQVETQPADGSTPSSDNPGVIVEPVPAE